MPSTCCKVGDVTDEYALDRRVVGGDVDEYLLARWRGEGDYNETGLRPLTNWFNRNLLKAVYADQGRTATTPRVESEYEALVSDDDIRRGEVLDDLEADDIDGEELVAAFISPSTLYRHFRNCLSETKESGNVTSADDSTWERDKVEHARQTARQNAEDAVRSLDNKGRIANASEAEIDVHVVLSCPECSTKVRLDAALERGYVCRDHLGAPEDGQGSEPTTPVD